MRAAHETEVLPAVILSPRANEASTDPLTITGGARIYAVQSFLGEGEVSTVSRVTWDEGGTMSTGALKLARYPAGNEMLVNEARVLRQLSRRGDPKFAAYAPQLRDAFLYHDPRSGLERQANVLELLDGFVSLAQVAQAYPYGVEARDAAWIWRRLLVALGYAHRAGVVHGAVTPEHVLIEPEQHGLVLIDWGYASTEPYRPISVMVSAHADLYPAEVAAGEPVGPGTDIFLATRTMKTILAGTAPRAFATFIEGCTGATLAERPTDAWDVQHDFDAMIERLWGPRRFRPFRWPGRDTPASA